MKELKFKKDFNAISSEAIRNCLSVLRGKSKKTRGLFL